MSEQKKPREKERENKVKPHETRLSICSNCCSNRFKALYLFI